jgi:tetratricopeptide (TPR) repeat protein
LPAEALKIVEWIHAQPDVFPITRTNQSEVMFVETSAKLANKDLVGAQETVNEALQKYPEDQQLISTAVRVYMDNRTFTNAIPLIERQLQASPTNTGWLLTNGVANLEAERYDAAIQPFTLLLSMETNAFSELHNTALLNRAIAYLKGGKLEESRQDYEALQKMFPTSARVYYGLGEIAYQLRETNAAIRNYQLYLTNGPTNPDEINKVSARLKELRPGYP